MKIAIGADHGGFDLKEELKKHLSGKYELLDLGTNSPESVDYPAYAVRVAKAVASGQAERGILVCGTGIGVSIVANKVKGIRAALCTSPFMAEMSRKHNDANVLALGGRILKTAEALKIVDVWLKTEFEGERHQKRLDQINALE